MVRRLVWCLFAAVLVGLLGVGSAAAQVQHVHARVEPGTFRSITSFLPPLPCLTNYGFGGSMELSYNGFYDMTIDSATQEMRVHGKMAVDISWSPILSEDITDTGPVTETGRSSSFRFRGVFPFGDGTFNVTYVAEMTHLAVPSTTQYVSGLPADVRIRDHLTFVNSPGPTGLGVIGLFGVGPDDAACV
jgi:hypothetical protein